MKNEFEKENLDEKKLLKSGIRDRNWISNLPLTQLILPCIRGSSEIPLLSLAKVFHKILSHLKSSPIEGNVGHTLDGAIVEDIRDQEQSSYLFNCWGLKQVEV